MAGAIKAGPACSPAHSNFRCARGDMLPAQRMGIRPVQEECSPTSATRGALPDLQDWYSSAGRYCTTHGGRRTLREEENLPDPWTVWRINALLYCLALYACILDTQQRWPAYPRFHRASRSALADCMRVGGLAAHACRTHACAAALLRASEASLASGHRWQCRPAHAPVWLPEALAHHQGCFWGITSSSLRNKFIFAQSDRAR